MRLGVDANTKDVKSFDSAVRNAAKGLAALSAVGVAALGGLAAIAISTGRTGDAAAKMARQLQLSTAEFQEYEFAAQRSGASTEQLSVGLKTLARQAFDAARGTGEGLIAFERLGISATDAEGKTRSITELLGEAADAIAGLDNESDKIAIAQKLFGEGGTALLPLLEQGSAGLADLRKQARELGFVLDEQASRDAEAFQDAMLDAGLAVQGLKTSIGADLLPIGIDLLEFFVASVKFVKPYITRFIDAIDATIGLRTALGLLVVAVGAVSAAASAAAGVIGFGALFAATTSLAGVFPILLSALSAAAGFIAAVGLPIFGVLSALFVGFAANVAAVVGGFVTLGLVVEDFVTFLTGGNSVVGEFVDSFVASRGPLGDVARLFVNLRGLFGEVIELARALGALFVATVTPAINGVVAALRPLVALLTRAASLIARTGLQGVGSLASAASVGVQALTGAATSSTSSVTNNVNATVNAPITSTAGAGETAQAVNEVLNGAMRRAFSEVAAVEG